jgi:hypothetical protein
MTEDNFNLEAELLEPFPRKIKKRQYLRVRNFRTDAKAQEAAQFIRNSKGLAMVIKWVAYGRTSFRVYANANGSIPASDAIRDVSCMGKKWSDW